MKKLLYSIIATLAFSCTLVACSDSNDDESYTYSTSADQATAGTYTGTWTRTLDGESETFEGSISLSSAGKAGVSNITFSNGLGAAFSGRISEDGVITAGFTISQKVGRKSYDYQYKFLGHK